MAGGPVRRDLLPFARRARGVLGRRGFADRLDGAVGTRARRLARAVLPLVHGRPHEHVLQRARSPRRRGPRRAARVDLRLAGHRHEGGLQLPRAARRRCALRRRARAAGRRPRRPSDRLHADGPGSARSDARMRPDRGRALGRFRWVRGKRARNTDRGRPAEGRRHGLVRDRAGACRRLQAAARRRHRGDRVEARMLHRPSACDARGRPRSGARPRLARRARSAPNPSSAFRSSRRTRCTSSTRRGRPGSRRGSSATTAATPLRSRGR